MITILFKIGLFKDTLLPQFKLDKIPRDPQNSGRNPGETPLNIIGYTAAIQLHAEKEIIIFHCF